jgi:hypothetical protein
MSGAEPVILATNTVSASSTYVFDQKRTKFYDRHTAVRRQSSLSRFNSMHMLLALLESSGPKKRVRVSAATRHYSLMENPSDLIRHLDCTRAGLRLAMTTIRKMKQGQRIDVDAVLRRLASIRAEAKEARDAVISTRAE